MPSAARPLPKRKPTVRVILVLVSLIAAWHVFAQFLWIAPASQLRTLVPGNLLTSWNIPFFGQSWSVFAPDPINGDYHLRVRAVDHVDGREVNTEWVDATEAENGLAEHNLFPPRAASLAAEQASKYKTAYDALNPAQKAVVANNWWKGDNWKGRLEMAVIKAAGNDASAIGKAKAFITANAFTDAYATQVARALWGKDITTLQFEVYRQNVIPFDQRNDPDAKPQPKQIATTGWRGAFVMPGQSADDFADTFKKLAEGGK